MSKVSMLFLMVFGCVCASTTGWAKSSTSKPAAKKESASTKKAKPAAKTSAVGPKQPAKRAAAKKPAAKKWAHADSKFSYVLGHDFGNRIGQMLAKGKIKFDPEALYKGIKDGVTGKGPGKRILMQWMIQLQMKYRANMMKSRQGNSSQNLVAGKKFLAANAKKKGVVVTKSGLQYQIIRPGTGPKPKATSTVVTHYRGTLLNGTVFDSSYRRGQPATFPVNGVIRGWVEALQLMRVGAKWRLYIPHHLAYGARGAGRSIGPYSTLIFDIELLKIKK